MGREREVAKREWSKPHHGVQHLGEMADTRWCTVSDYGAYGEFSELTLRGVGIPMLGAPTHDFFGHGHAERARAAGEAWVRSAATPLDVSAPRPAVPKGEATAIGQQVVGRGASGQGHLFGTTQAAHP